LRVGAVSLQLFRVSNFRALWIGQLISIFGDRLTYLALLALVLERAADPSNPAAELALIPLASFLPAILFSPWAGALVDRWNTRATLLISDGIRAVLVLAMIPAAGWGGLPAVFGLVFLLYLVNAFFLPARSAILPDLVPRETLVEANALATLAGVVATIVGSVAGGLLVERMGWKLGFQVDAATYLVSVAALAFIRVAPRAAPVRADTGRTQGIRRIARDVREGAHLALASPPTVGALAATTLLWVAGGALHVSLPQVLGHHGAGVISGLGGALGAAALGMVAGTVLLSDLVRTLSGRKRVILGLAGAGAAIIAFAALRHPAALACAAFAAGGFVVLLLVTTEAVMQASIAAEARGRVFALRDFLARAGVLASAAIFGLVLRKTWISPEWVVAVSGGCLVMGSLVGVALRRGGIRKTAEAEQR
jgi:MFS family permease